MAKIIRFDSCEDCPFSRDYEVIEDTIYCPIIAAPYWKIILNKDKKHEDCMFEKGAWITACTKCPYSEFKGTKQVDRSFVKMYECTKLDNKPLEYPHRYDPECPLEEMDLEE